MTPPPPPPETAKAMRSLKMLNINGRRKILSAFSPRMTLLYRSSFNVGAGGKKIKEVCVLVHLLAEMLNMLMMLDSS